MTARSAAAFVVTCVALGLRARCGIQVALFAVVLLMAPDASASFSLYSKAWSLVTSGQLDQAERLFRAARTDAPSHLQWLVDDGLAWVAFYRQNYAEAEAAFKRNLETHPGAYLSRKGLGFIAIERADYPAALDHLMVSFRQNPYQVLASYTLPALRLVENNRHQDALQILELGGWVYPESADIKFLQARAYKGLGDVSTATALGIEAARLAPAYIDPAFDDLGVEGQTVLEAYAALGWGLLMVGENEAALHRFEQYLEYSDSNPNIRRGRGFALYRLRRYDEAIIDLQVASAHEPARLSPIIDAIPDPAVAGKTWEIVYDATSTMAWAYYFTEQYEKAAALFRKVVSRNPDWVDAHTGLGYSLAELGRTEDAVAEFRQALRLLPGYPFAREGLEYVGVEG